MLTLTPRVRALTTAKCPWPSIIILLLAWLVAPSASSARDIIEARYANGDVSLAAALILPDGSNPVPAVVLVQGSGTSDRSNPWARLFAEFFVERGVAVLLTDKRGSGASTGDWRSAGFEDVAADALAGVRYLHSQDRIDPARIGLVGLSQGGRVVPVVAALSDEVKFVVNVVGDAVSFGEQSFHELLNLARKAGLDAKDTREVIELNRAAGHYVLTGDWQPFSERLQAGMSRPWRRIAAGFPPTKDAPIWTFLRKASTFDPMPYWVLVRQPVLVLYGEEDETDKVAVAESRRRLEFGFMQSGKDNFEIAVLPGLGHALTEASGRALHPQAVGALDAWLRREVRAPRSVSP